MDEIKLLLEKYYGGESTAADESRLRDLLATVDFSAADPALQADARAFLAMERYADAEIAAIAHRVETTIDFRMARACRRRHRMLAIAASLTLLIAAGGIFFVPRHNAGQAVRSYDFAGLMAQIDMERSIAPHDSRIVVEDSVRAAEISRQVLGLLASKLECSAGAVARTGEIGSQTFSKSLNPLQNNILNLQK